ncbi:MAG: CRISPR-associated protein Cas4 [Candidatus Micrarchaeota archaeon]|nr:MAG: CRISPR-associated protein Cas4 [Candidatus Micrarchaeota archaeon]
MIKVKEESLSDIEFNDISGVEVQYYFTCKTELWLFSHQILYTNEDENVLIGRLLHESKYKRKKKELSINRSKLDVFNVDPYLIYELKKSKITEGDIYQLKFYLYQVYLATNKKPKGVIITKGFRRLIELSDEDIKTIESALEDIKIIKSLDVPPKPEYKKICRLCSYRRFCFGDIYE